MLRIQRNKRVFFLHDYKTVILKERKTTNARFSHVRIFSFAAILGKTLESI